MLLFCHFDEENYIVGCSSKINCFTKAPFVNKINIVNIQSTIKIQAIAICHFTSPNPMNRAERYYNTLVITLLQDQCFGVTILSLMEWVSKDPLLLVSSSMLKELTIFMMAWIKSTMKL